MRSRRSRAPIVGALIPLIGLGVDLSSASVGRAEPPLGPPRTPRLDVPPERDRPERETTKTSAAAAVERGRYLTHHVAMCIQCHSPRDEGGDIIETDTFTGAVIPMTQPDWAEDWAARSANLRALVREDPERVISVLTTGLRPNGTDPRDPMPPFRLKLADAQAIVRYLESLPLTEE